MRTHLRCKEARLEGGKVLPYLAEGPRAATPVLFLHGLTDSCRSFQSVISHLPGTVRAIAPTQRGHAGASAPERYRVADFADDLAEFMDLLALERAVLVGHSMGSVIAQRFAIDYPDRVAGLMLVGGFAALGRNPASVAFGETYIRTLSDPIDPAFVRAFQESTLARPLPESALDEIVQDSLTVPARVWKAIWSDLIATDLTPDLLHVLAPTLLVWGDRDGIALDGEQAILRGAIRNARLVTFAGAGHAPHWEEPERFAGVVSDFVRALAPERAASAG